MQVKRYSTQVSASKKELRSGVQSDSVRKFLARKEQEEKQQQYEEKVKKEVCCLYCRFLSIHFLNALFPTIFRCAEVAEFEVAGSEG